MFLLLVVVIGLVAWALHLMQEAFEQREFSLMLAGFLVASAAAAMMTVYFLMNSYMGYVTHITETSYSASSAIPSIVWTSQPQEFLELDSGV